uniref:Uncharacterized protein n=1 Tax=Castor canadensis TaxID=51338 RepID=A0A8C0W0H2_CASCN
MDPMNLPIPREVTFKNMRLLITHNPTNVTLNTFIEELKTYGFQQAVQFLRQKKHGAFNTKQLLYLGKYHSKMQLFLKDSNGHRNNCLLKKKKSWGT